MVLPVHDGCDSVSIEARRYYQHVAKKSIADAILRLKDETLTNSVGVVKAAKFGYLLKLTRFQTDWDSGPYNDSSGPLPTSVVNASSTTNTVIPTLCRIFGTINDFIDKVRYIQLPDDANPKGVAEKNELAKALKRDVMIQPSLVPQTLWQRYLQKFEGYESFKPFIRRFTLLAKGLSANQRSVRKIVFYKAGSTSSTGSGSTTTSTASALTVIQP